MRSKYLGNGPGLLKSMKESLINFKYIFGVLAVDDS